MKRLMCMLCAVVIVLGGFMPDALLNVEVYEGIFFVSYFLGEKDHIKRLSYNV